MIQSRWVSPIGSSDEKMITVSLPRIPFFNTTRRPGLASAFEGESAVLGRVCCDLDADTKATMQRGSHRVC